MLKLFSTSVWKPLEIIFHRCLEVENDLLNSSGFKPGDSCINQLLSITHDILKFFDCDYEVRVDRGFVDILKSLDKGCHDVIIFNLEHNGISGKLYKCFT